MPSGLRDCPFCGAENGRRDPRCWACGTEPMPSPEEVEGSYWYASRYQPPDVIRLPSTPADFNRIRAILKGRGLSLHRVGRSIVRHCQRHR